MKGPLATPDPAPPVSAEGIVSALRRTIEWAGGGWIAFLFGESTTALWQVHHHLAGTPGIKRYMAPIGPDILLGSPDEWARLVADTAAGETTLLLVDLLRTDLRCTGHAPVWAPAVRTALANLNAVRSRLLANPYGLVFVLPGSTRAKVPAWCPDLWSVRQFSLDFPPLGGPPPIEVSFDVSSQLDLPQQDILLAESMVERARRSAVMEWCRLLRRVETASPLPGNVEALAAAAVGDVDGLGPDTLVVLGGRTLNAAQKAPAGALVVMAEVAAQWLTAAGDRPDALAGAAQALRVAAHGVEFKEPGKALAMAMRARALTERLVERAPVGAWQAEAQRQHAASLVACASSKAAARDPTARADVDDALRLVEAQPLLAHLRVSVHLQAARMAWLEGDEGASMAHLDAALALSARPGTPVEQLPYEAVRALAALMYQLTWLGRLECIQVVDAFGLHRPEAFQACAQRRSAVTEALAQATLRALALARREDALRDAVAAARALGLVDDDVANRLLAPASPR